MYQRTSDGLWCFAIELPNTGQRRRKVLARMSREAAEAALAEWRAKQPLAPMRSRVESMDIARTIGTRTRAETRAKRRAQPNVCPYCKTALNVFNEVEDHIVPVALGGSDAIDNVHWVCWECNLAKGTRLDYRYRGSRPRTFKPTPKMRHQWAQGRRTVTVGGNRP